MDQPEPPGPAVQLAELQAALEALDLPADAGWRADIEDAGEGAGTVGAPSDP